MSRSDDFMDRGVRRVLLIQALMTVAVAGGFLLHRGAMAAMAAVGGGAITLLSSWWMARSVRRGGTLTASNPAHGSLVLFGGLAQKYLFAIVALAVGFALRLDAVALLAGFGVPHLAFLFAGAGRNGHTGNSHDRKGC